MVQIVLFLKLTELSIVVLVLLTNKFKLSNRVFGSKLYFFTIGKIEIGFGLIYILRLLQNFSMSIFDWQILDYLIYFGNSKINNQKEC